MGFGNHKTFTEVDIMESSIVNDPHSNAVRFRNRIYNHVILNRDLLGYPKSINKLPYMFMSNDLSGIFMEFMQMIDNHKHQLKIKEISQDLIEILKLLIMSYDDAQCEQKCCAFWHSVDKEVFVSMHEMLKDKLRELVTQT